MQFDSGLSVSHKTESDESGKKVVRLSDRLERFNYGSIPGPCGFADDDHYDYLASLAPIDAYYAFAPPCGGDYLYIWWKSAILTIDEVRIIIADLWPNLEECDRANAMWLEIFRATGYVSDCSRRPVTDTLLWMAGRATNTFDATNIAWKLDVHSAIRDATYRASYEGREAAIYAAKVAPEALLAVFRKEDPEFIVDPDLLIGAAKPHRMPNRWLAADVHVESQTSPPNGTA